MILEKPYNRERAVIKLFPLLGGGGGDSPVRGNVAKRQKGCALPKGLKGGGGGVAWKNKTCHFD